MSTAIVINGERFQVHEVRSDLEPSDVTAQFDMEIHVEEETGRILAVTMRRKS